MAARERVSSRGRSRERDDEDDKPRARSGLSRSSDRGGSGRRKGGFVYQKRTPEQVKARAEQTGGRFDSYLQQGIDMYRSKDGENTIRYLPPTWSPAEHYGYDVWVHGFIGTDGSSYLCLDKMKKEHCPICAAAKEAKDAGDDEEAKALTPNKRVIAWVLDRDENIGKDGPKPQVYSQSWSFDRDIAALCDTKKGALYIDNDEEGYDVTYRKKGKALNTRYFGMQIDRDPSPICEDQADQDAVIAYIEENPLPDVLKFYSAEHLQKVIEGTSEPKDEDLDEKEDKGRRSSRRDRDDDEPRGRSRRDDKDEEVDERPARRRTRDRDEEPEDEEPQGRGRVHRGRDDTREEEDRPRGRSRSTRDDREEDERPSRSRRDKDEEAEPDEKPRRTRSRDAEDDDRPARRRSRDEDDDKPSRTRGRTSSRDEVDEPEPDEEDAVEEPEDEPDDRPARRSSSRRR